MGERNLRVKSHLPSDKFHRETFDFDIGVDENLLHFLVGVG